MTRRDQPEDEVGAVPPAAPGVTRVVELAAPPDAVWRALTDPEEVGGWFGAAVEWDLRPGGGAGFGDDGDGRREGRVEEVEPARRLRYRWWPEGGKDDASVVTYELAPVPGGTRLTVTEAPAGAPRATLLASAPSWHPWDSRLVGLWVGCQARCRIGA